MKQPTREDYELAAKAAGIDWIPADTDAGKRAELKFGLWLNVDQEPTQFTRRRFNPLHDDGDSRRLQIACGIDLILHNCSQEAVAQLRQDAESTWLETNAYYKDHNNDECEAARHAVFELAIEIGRAMP